MNEWVLTSWVTIAVGIFSWSMVQLVRIAISLSRIADRLWDIQQQLKPISAAANGVTNTTKNKEDDAYDEKQPSYVVKQGEFNEPTDKQ